MYILRSFEIFTWVDDIYGQTFNLMGHNKRGGDPTFIVAFFHSHNIAFFLDFQQARTSPELDLDWELMDWVYEIL